jgi:hypothetical protein
MAYSRRRSEGKRKEGARNDAALEILENKGFEIGAAVMHKDGRVQIAVSSKNDSAMVEVGRELWDFAAGLVNLPEINARRKTGQ